MNESQTHLHSENFDLCRICLLEPESNRDIKFFHVFTPNNEGLILSETIMEFLGVTIDKDDVKPKIICQNCHKSVLGWIEMKKRAAESQIVINYIEKKRYAAVPRTSALPALTSSEVNQSSSNITIISTHSKSSIGSKNSYYSSTQSQSSTSNNSRNRLSIQNNVCSSSSSSAHLDNHTQSTFNQLTKLPVDDQTSESDDDTSCQVVNVADEVIFISDSESDYESIQSNNLKSEFMNNDKIKKLNYCSICKKKQDYNHICSQYNKEFSTCLVPNCNILSRSTRDFTPHYRQHIGLPTGVVLCRRCFKENKKSERDENGCHINCFTTNLFKCYTCNSNFNNMAEFAFHKLKTHNARLMNSSGNYLCFYCEKSSPDLMQINEHAKQCLENQTETITKSDVEKEESVKKILIGKNYMKNGIVLNNKKGKIIPRSSTHLLFTCIKPSCNLIFQNFAVFKLHHREHFALGNELMCWQCCSPFYNLNSLRAHQVKGNCRTPGIFKCYECSEQYNDLQSLSIHKFTSHNGELILNKKNKKTMKCANCKVETSISNLKTHLIKCQSKKEKKIISKPIIIKKCGPFKCDYCGKVCLTAAALSSHVKIHLNLPRKLFKKNKNGKPVKRKFCESTDTSEKKTFGEINSQSNVSIKSNDFNAADTSIIEKIDVENALPTTSENNKSTKSDDCNMTNSSVINETDIENHTTFPSTSLNNESVGGMSNSSNIKESGEGINLTSSNSKDNETHNIIDHDMSLGVEEEIYSCLKCSKKFSSRRGLSIHISSHSSVKGFPKMLTRNYYCTKCKESFTRSGFGDHWRSSHGKKLPYHKSKRYSCSICLRKFMYRIALLMHKEHKHSDLENLVTGSTSLDSSKNLPLISTITTDQTPVDSSIMLPEVTMITTDEGPVEFPLIIDIFSKDFEGNVENNHNDCNEKTNTQLKISNEEPDSKIEQKNEINVCKNSEKQDFSNHKDDNIDNIHENIIQSGNKVNVAEEQVTKPCDSNMMMVDDDDDNRIEENLLPKDCKTIVAEKQDTVVIKNEKNINSVVEKKQNC